ncbi:uncharacterized protein N7483_010621 [Penicillium malachiteum]|uniref:uncharacterized protein n=1 Tax=Penicillium malachiteum TaxID=1324776 RepID=UPI002547C1F1|nr:uncharacterized protein N7483_010621 [Penicillium malachiteum]KAJ5713440.1 hypothetical protein N7483_010621 [Penicillium malachiteum]
MEFFVVAAASLMQSVCNNLSPQYAPGFIHSLCNRGDIATDLGVHLSSGTNIWVPGSSKFDIATTRWSALDAPNISIVVEVATEDDVKYANENNLPFLAYNGGHGAIETLSTVENGIQIWLNQLNSVFISQDGQTATFGGGVKSKHVTDALWAAAVYQHGHFFFPDVTDQLNDFKIVTGGCECTSLLGPGLGGGHGFLQGWHGLIADQFVSLDMVLANGSKITVDDDSELWWAVKGAGHNFGIVTSVTSKIYDVPDDGLWSYKSYFFTHDKVEELYDAINRYFLKGGKQPVGLINYSFFFNYPTVDPNHPLIAFFILRQGVEAIEEEYAAPFDRLGPVMSMGDKGTYKDLPMWTSNAEDSLPCQKAGLVNARFPVDLQSYNPTTQRLAFDTFSNFTQKFPAFNNSLFLFEGYSLQGVQSIEDESTAFPHREGNLLVAPLIIYQPTDKERDAQGVTFGENLRQIVFRGSGQDEMFSYVNYAFGNEAPEAWYGYESWRLERLRSLKAKYDPNGRFNFYAPFY